MVESIAVLLLWLPAMHYVANRPAVNLRQEASPLLFGRAGLALERLLRRMGPLDQVVVAPLQAGQVPQLRNPAYLSAGPTDCGQLQARFPTPSR